MNISFNNYLENNHLVLHCIRNKVSKRPNKFEQDAVNCIRSYRALLVELAVEVNRTGLARTCEAVFHPQWNRD